MAANKEEPKKVPVKVAISEMQILCSGSTTPSKLKANPSNVHIKGKPILLDNSIDLQLNIEQFANCNLNPLKKCVFASCSLWDANIENTTSLKNKPLTVEDTLKCDAYGGDITFIPTPVAPAAPENIVDKAQSKINKAANSVTKKATEVAQAANDAIDGIADAAKEAGGFLKNESVTKALQGTSDFVDDVDRKKAGLDVSVANLDIRLNNLRKELKQLLTGQEQELQDLMTIEDVNETQENTDTTSETIEEENRYSQEYFNEENERAVNEFLTGINNDIDTLTENTSRLDTTKDYDIIVDEGSANSTRLLTEDPLPATAETNNTPSNTTNPTTNPIQNTVDQIDAANSTVSEFGITAINNDNQANVRQSLAVLNDLTSVLNNDINTSKNITDIANVPTVEETINVERDELNSRVQGEINELLKEIEYAEKSKKYNEESGELQEDLDKASATLDILGDFDAFIDGIAAKHMGKLLKKYKEGINKLGKNMNQLNTSMQGLSYAAGGFTAGDVITHIPEKDKKEGENDEDGDGTGVAGAGNIFGSLDDVLNDRNEEPRILRIYAIYAQDPEEGETYKKGDIVTADTILPGIRVDLIIQANGKANGEKVDLNLQGRTFHYRQVGKDKDDTDRIIEDITLLGESPNFKNGESYDVSDPNYALDTSGKRKEKPLNDKTEIKFISRLPIEEENEEELF
ncbi:PAAR-like protein [uncultured Aquimarina sp.]|uniref:PAAR-like protein n=1 Tax=uncultured Aquimarina sp. TaxID=575652 RepID=UPI0026085D06|nr:PAAR-like protein [uncultured Aquimarina sp.]